MLKTASTFRTSAPGELGVRPVDGGVEAAVFSHHGDAVWFCQFDGSGEREIARWRLAGRDGDIHHGFIPGIREGDRYGLRADGPYEPGRGHRFDPSKLLADPYARQFDRPFAWRIELAAPRSACIDTAAFVPRAIVGSPAVRDKGLRRSATPGLIYEVAVRTFTRRHPDVPLHMRGRLAGLAHPRLIDHMQRIGVTHVEVLPLAAWVDERHLAPLGLTNVWGYNPVTFMALDPRLAPAGMANLRDAVAALDAAGIAVIMDVVFNHTAESDTQGPVLSLRGLDNAVYYRHTGGHPAELVNDTGCGNTLACENAPVVRLVLDSLRRYVTEAGVAGFRFDLAAALVRGPQGGIQNQPVLSAIAQDPLLRNSLLIAEPWDVGPDGYQLGRFPAPWLEWNDRYRDGVRKFWRGDEDATGEFATRLAGSADFFHAPGRRPSAGVNFLASHDGFTLRDCVSYADRHNAANGENNRDGHAHNLSWNCGAEGESDDAAINARRAVDARAMFATLFSSRGTPMLTAGDELGRTQNGNNNAYAQDNATAWIDWEQADEALTAFVAELAQWRRRYLESSFGQFLTGQPVGDGASAPDVAWLRCDGAPMTPQDWRDANLVSVTLACHANGCEQRIHLAFNRAHECIEARLPATSPGKCWMLAVNSAMHDADMARKIDATAVAITARSVMAFVECDAVDPACAGNR